MISVRLVPVGAVRCGSQSWRAQGKAYATIIVKATFALGQGGALSLVDDAEDVLSRDEHVDKSPTKSLRDCSDLAPYVSAPEILIRGTVHVPAGQRIGARVLVHRAGAALVDRRFFVQCPPRPAKEVEPVALVAENAVGGPGHAINPVGRQDPLLFDVQNGAIPCLLGPIARTWRARASLLRPDDKKALQKREIAIEDGFAWEFFQAASRDQRAAAFFQGDETVLVQGFSPQQPSVEMRLPGAQAAAVWMRPDAEPVPITLRADLMRIDTDKRRVVLTWRGFFEVSDATGRMVVAAGLALPNRPIEWPEIAPVAEEDEPPADEKAAIVGLDATGVLRLDGLNAPTLPFAYSKGAQAVDEKKAASPLPGAPWAGPTAPAPAAKPSAPRTVALNLADAPASSPPPMAPAIVPPTPAGPSVLAHRSVEGPAAAPPLAAPLPPVVVPVATVVDKSDVMLAPGLGSKLLLAVVEKVVAE